MPQFLVFLFALLFFITLLVIGTFIYWGIWTRTQMKQMELAHRLGHSLVLQARPKTEVPAWMGSLGMWVHHLQLHAGEEHPPQALLVRMGIFGLGGALLFGFILGLRGIAMGALFSFIPLLFLMREARARTTLLTMQLPDAMDLIGRALRSGHAFNDALQQAAIEIPLPLSDELATISEQNRMGLDLRDCLLELVERNSDNFDIRLFVGMVLLNRDTGGNLIEALSHLADTIRERLIFGEKVHALTAEVRISAIILSTLPFFVTGVLVALRPAYLIPLITTDLGRGMLIGAASSLMVGILLMWKFSAVES